MSTDYTQSLDDELWNLSMAVDETEDFSLITSFLNQAGTFRSFGEGIIAIINLSNKNGLDKTQVIDYIEKSCEKNGVDLSEIASKNTLINWFEKGSRPKKGEASRRSTFALSFALDFSIEETANLFHNIYLDRAFNFRSIEEIIYYYCKLNKKSWNEAKQIIQTVSQLNTNKTDNTKYTIAIKSDVEQLHSNEQLLEFIRENSHNFDMDSVAAKLTRQSYLTEAKKCCAREIKKPEFEDYIKDKWKKENEISNNLLFEVITGRSVTGKKGTKTIFNNVDLPKEITHRFPEAASFGKAEIGSEELRKTIILLFSYCVWYKSQETHMVYDFDDYCLELNSLLMDSNFSDLYFGNPFDWLFLYCAQSENPLDSFRDVLAQAFGD